MRVLFTRFPLESALGGAEVQTIALMRGLRERGHAVEFLGGCPTLLELCAERGIPATRLVISPPPVTAWLALSFLWRARPMRRKLRAAIAALGRIDAVCMLSLTEKIVLTPDLAGRGTRVLWIEHDRVGRWLTQNPWLGFLRSRSRLAQTVCVSELSRRIHLGLGWDGDRTVVIPNGIDRTRLGESRSPAIREKSGVLRLGCVARLTRDKGVDLLIRAMADVPAATLAILGSGSEEKALRMETAALGLSSRITFVPRAANIANFYRSIDALALPSREHDPFGLVAGEAMTLGVPAIVTDACGIAGALRSGEDAIVVRAGDVEALVEGIRTMIDPATRARIAAAGKQTAKERFSIETMVDAYERLLS